MKHRHEINGCLGLIAVISLLSGIVLLVAPSKEVHKISTLYGWFMLLVTYLAIKVSNLISKDKD